MLDDDNILILGGSGGPSFYYADAWVLNMVGDIWKWIPVEVRNSEDAPSNLWCNPVCKVSLSCIYTNFVELTVYIYILSIYTLFNF